MRSLRGSLPLLAFPALFFPTCSGCPFGTLAPACVCFDFMLIVASLRVTRICLHVVWLLSWFGISGFPGIAQPEPAYLVVPPNLAHATFFSGRVPFAPVLYVDSASSFFSNSGQVLLSLSVLAGYGLKEKKQLAEYWKNSQAGIPNPQGLLQAEDSLEGQS